MAITILKPPVPSTALERILFKKLPGRRCAIICLYEDEETGSMVNFNLIFDGVEVFKCTYHKAVSLEMIKISYNKLVELEDSELLRKTRDQLIAANIASEDLRHLMIYFDDGPCYEFICSSVHSNTESIINEQE